MSVSCPLPSPFVATFLNIRCAAVACAIAAAQLAGAAGVQGSEVLERWLSTHTGVSTIRVDFTQTRKMRTLRVPMRQEGVLLMDHQTGRFRWELGNPPQTVVLKKGADLLIVRTPMKRYERRPAGGNANGSGGIAMLASGFPRTPEEFHAKYRVLSIQLHDNVHRIATKPLGTAGRGVESFTFVVGAGDYRLRGMELRLEDGSSVDTVFRRVIPNAQIDAGLFQFDLAGYQQTRFND